MDLEKGIGKLIADHTDYTTVAMERMVADYERMQVDLRLQKAHKIMLEIINQKAIREFTLTSTIQTSDPNTLLEGNVTFVNDDFQSWTERMYISVTTSDKESGSKLKHHMGEVNFYSDLPVARIFPAYRTSEERSPFDVPEEMVEVIDAVAIDILKNKPNAKCEMGEKALKSFYGD